MEGENLERIECADCGELMEELAPAFESLDGSIILCFECATRRGGLYDAERDEWVEPPELSDVPGLPREVREPPP